MKTTFNLLFFLKRDKQKKNGNVPLMCRITVDGNETRFSMKTDIDPGLEVNQEKVKTKLFEDTKENIADNLGNSLCLNKKQTEIWSRLITPLSLNILIPQIIKRRNFILFSLTVAKWEENEKIIGVGMLGNVILFSELNQ